MTIPLLSSSLTEADRRLLKLLVRCGRPHRGAAAAIERSSAEDGISAIDAIVASCLLSDADIAETIAEELKGGAELEMLERVRRALASLRPSLQIETARSSEEALSDVRRSRPHVILPDGAYGWTPRGSTGTEDAAA